MQILISLRLKLLSVLFVLLILVIGCKKEESKVGFQLSPALRDFYKWKPGSYWVMQDSASGDLDSFYVTEYREFTTPVRGFLSEAIEITIRQVPVDRAADTTTWQLILNYVSDNYLSYEHRGVKMYFTNIILDPYRLKYDSVNYNGIWYHSAVHADTYYALGSVPDSRQKMSLVLNKSNGLLYLKTSEDQASRTYTIRSSRIR